jgi:putative nucleotidyltransferase with HDIG domain
MSPHREDPGLSAIEASPSAMAVLDRLWSAGHAGFLVGGGVRDALLGRGADDWDIATDATPERLLELFPEGRYENRFGTVLVDDVQVTTFRRDHQYPDHRRPESVTFTDSLEEDLARRDFTVNAIAWGRSAGQSAPGIADPTGGLTDLEARVLRAVGDPDRRFEEDALRLLRAARLAAQVGLRIEPATFEAMRAHAPDAAWVSSERIGDEIRRMIGGPRPGEAFRILDQTRILDVVLPELAAQRGVPQAKIPGHDLWSHSLATLEAAAALPRGGQPLRLAALLHDVGKPSTFADGHFLGHDGAGARIARELLARIHHPSQEADRICRLIGEHMFQYQPEWGDAAVRRFVRRVGPDLVHQLISLREADNVGSGLEPDAGHLAELRGRVTRVLEDGQPLRLADLAVDGSDLLAEFGRPPGPWVGELLDRLLDSVLTDPRRNSRDQLLADARAWTSSAEPGAGRLGG